MTKQEKMSDYLSHISVEALQGLLANPLAFGDKMVLEEGQVEYLAEAAVEYALALIKELERRGVKP